MTSVSYRSWKVSPFPLGFETLFIGLAISVDVVVLAGCPFPPKSVGFVAGICTCMTVNSAGVRTITRRYTHTFQGFALEVYALERRSTVCGNEKLGELPIESHQA